MVQQLTCGDGGRFEKHAKRTRRAEFLSQMNTVVPWRELCAKIEPFYPKASQGRPPVRLERMLRMYFLQGSSTRRWKKRYMSLSPCAIS